MITSDLYKMGLFQFKEFEKFLPKPKLESLDGDLLGVKTSISIYPHDLLEYDRREYFEEAIAYHWEAMYEDVIRRIARLTSGKTNYFVTRFIPRMTESNSLGIVLELLVDCFVAPTRNVYIPEIVYENVGDFSQIKEWRCGYCRSPNKMGERHCTQCGSPRALLIQEM